MKDKKNIFYAVIGVATLMLAIVGATFAYFTATASNTETITGNSATINFDVSVTKMTDVDVARNGLIPMSNNMIEQALTKNAEDTTKGICVDDNGNAVCQVYKIIVVNNSTSSMFVDGYVTLFNGSGTPTDITGAADLPAGYTTVNDTTMRWAQAFCSTETSGKVTACTTEGTSTVRPDSGSIAISKIGISEAAKADGKNQNEIKFQRTSVTYAASDTTNAPLIKGNRYEVIKQNYIRVSNHAESDTTYTRTDDTTSALVYNQYLDANDNTTSNNTGTSSSTYTDAQVYYIVVWLSENGQNQTLGATGAATQADGFFRGTATFLSAEGNEVTATFNGLTQVNPTDTPGAQS